MAWSKDLLGNTLLVHENGNVVVKSTQDVVAGKKFIALYFSAHVSGAALPYSAAADPQLLHPSEGRMQPRPHTVPSICRGRGVNKRRRKRYPDVSLLSQQATN